MDALILARMQFAANISFHILFPDHQHRAGLVAAVLPAALLRGEAHDRSAQGWQEAYRFWTKVFALSFALGVVIGITMSFQFGTNWPGFMERVGQHRRAAAGLRSAHRLLPRSRPSSASCCSAAAGCRERVHLIATFLVAVGTTLSAFWILALNSWMQTPTGHEIVDGEFHAPSWLAVIFNPSFPYRLAHMLLASALTGAFLVAGLSAWQLLRGAANARHAPRAARRA